MKQKDFSFESVEHAIKGIASIRGFALECPHADMLITLYTSGVAADDMKRLLAALDSAFPEAKRAGISEYPYESSGIITRGYEAVRLNVMLSDSARFHALQILCAPGDEHKAAAQFTEALRDAPM